MLYSDVFYFLQNHGAEEVCAAAEYLTPSPL
jgi:hypothetical protein